MVMPDRLPSPLPASPEVRAYATAGACVVVAPVVAAAESTDAPKLSSFTAKYKLQILAETDRATNMGGISAILRREGLYSSSLERLAGPARSRHTGGVAAPPARSAKACHEPFASRTGQGQS